MIKSKKLNTFKKYGFHYNSKTGDILGIKGDIIIRKNNKGYILCTTWLRGKKGKYITVLGHVLSWYLHYEEIPNRQLDHIDGNKSNNKIENLRLATNQQNSFNRKDVKGYTWVEHMKKWRATISLNGKHIHLGYFRIEKEARKAYLEAKKIYHII